jgi:hypothetical protein
MVEAAMNAEEDPKKCYNFFSSAANRAKAEACSQHMGSEVGGSNGAITWDKFMADWDKLQRECESLQTVPEASPCATIGNETKDQCKK